MSDKIESLLVEQNKLLQRILSELTFQTDKISLGKIKNPASEISLGESTPVTLGADIKTYVIIQLLTGQTGNTLKYTPLDEVYGSRKDAEDRASQIQRVGDAALASAKVVTVQQYFDLKNTGYSVESSVADKKKAKLSKSNEDLLLMLNAIFGPPPKKNSDL